MGSESARNEAERPAPEVMPTSAPLPAPPHPVPLAIAAHAGEASMPTRRSDPDDPLASLTRSTVVRGVGPGDIRRLPVGQVGARMASDVGCGHEAHVTANETGVAPPKFPESKQLGMTNLPKAG